MIRLTLIRHAKSDWSDPALRDFDRPLNHRGRKNAPEMGRRLARRGFMPDLILSSPARRALSTARSIAEEIGYPGERIQNDERIYEADVETLMDIIHGLNDTVRHAALVGHNPGLTELAHHLTGDGPGNIPTCGVFHIHFDLDDWQAVWSGSGQSGFYDYPKKR